MRLGIIGSGLIVQEFLPKLVQMEGMKIEGILGVPQQIDQVKKLCEEHQISLATSDFDELCASGIDTVYIAVPNFLHYEYCKKALDKGLNVIVEKPMTSNLKEALALKELAQSKKLFIFEAVTTLYLESFKKIKEWLPQIGEIKLVQSQYSQYSRRYDSFRKGEVLPVFDPKKAGGALMDLNLYNLHYVMGLFGEPDDVKYYANIEKEIDTSGLLVLKYPSFVAYCVGAKDSQGIYGGVIQGTNGYIESTLPPNLIGEVTLHLNDGTEEKFDGQSWRERLIPEFKEFIQTINDNDLDHCYEQLDKSIAVCSVQTRARIEAGIIFPND